MKKILNWNDNFQINLVSRALHNGEIVLGNSDTVLGLLADISEKGFQSLNKMKDREKKPYLFLIDSPNKISFFSDATITPQLNNLIKKCWPGPVTLCFKSKENIPYYMKSETDTVGLRVPCHPGLLYLLKDFTGLFSTSANKSGESVAKCIKDVDPEIIKSVAYIITNTGTDIECSGATSTILDCTNPKIKVKREGAYPVSKLEKFYGESFDKP